MDILTIIDVTYKVFAIIGVIITSIAALHAMKKGKQRIAWSVASNCALCFPLVYHRKCRNEIF